MGRLIISEGRSAARRLICSEREELSLELDRPSPEPPEVELVPVLCT
jgi:hypothetical protein